MKALLGSALALALGACAVAQIGILQIRVTEGEGAIHMAGTRAARPLVVEISDATGRPVPAVGVTFQLPEEGPGGLFSNGLRTELVTTDAVGRAALRGIQWNRSPGQFQIRILAVKGDTRAGVVSFQYISDAHAAAAVKSRKSRRTLAVVLLAVAGAAGGGLAASLGRGGKTASTLATPTPASITIGPPVITVGKP